MHVEVITEMGEFEALAAAWDAVYAEDPDAQVYLSHAWLRGWLEAYPTVWLVLAVRPAPGADYVAFLPLRIRATFDAAQGFYNDVVFAGDLYGDYNGLLCRPEHDEQAIPALANHVRHELNWAELRLDNWFVGEARRKLFLQAFESPGFQLRTISTFNAVDGVNNDVCPYVDLPDDWDAYLAGLSANNRQKIRRLLRKVEESDDYRITIAGPAQIERDLETLLEYWRAKWEPTKGAHTATLVGLHRGVLGHCARRGMLFLPTFWCGDRPVAALATLVDARKGSYHFVVTGRDESFDEIAAGYVLHAFSIRHAIAQGARIYDFLRGDESYKYLFGAHDRPVVTLGVTAPGRRNLQGGLDARTLPWMSGLSRVMAEQGQWAEAATGYRQVLELAPRDPEALFWFARSLSHLGDAPGARAALERCVEADPRNGPAWAALSEAREAAGEAEAALAAARRAVELMPNDQPAVNLAWRLDKALAAARPLQPAAQASGLDLIRRATQKSSGLGQGTFDAGPRVSLDPGLLPGGPLRRR